MPLCVCLLAQQFKKLTTYFDEIFPKCGCVTSNKLIRFSDHDADAGISKRKLYHCEIGAIERILLITQEVVDE